jgi:hypothetical protein
MPAKAGSGRLSSWANQTTSLRFVTDLAGRVLRCFYIPAYIVADMTTALQMVDPAFTLTHGFDSNAYNKRITLQSEKTWTEYARGRWGRLNHSQAVASDAIEAGREPACRWTSWPS